VNQAPGAGYVERWADFVLLPEFVDVLRVLKSKGYEAVIVTNQKGVARGSVTMETVNEIHRNLRAVLKREHGLDLLDILCCPHGDDECQCRKPKPGMLLEAARRHDLDLRASWMIGDQGKDIEAGRAAGCRTILVSGNADENIRADYRVRDMVELKLLVEKVL
jgi:D-glycero-D-manno-heptose 1,7-bisphosphate phosphatase